MLNKSKILQFFIIKLYEDERYSKYGFGPMTPPSVRCSYCMQDNYSAVRTQKRISNKSPIQCLLMHCYQLTFVQLGSKLCIVLHYGLFHMQQTKGSPNIGQCKGKATFTVHHCAHAIMSGLPLIYILAHTSSLA